MNHIQLFAYWPSSILRPLRQWWFKRAEQHYLICADVEAQRAREAMSNVAFYQKRAAIARSNQG